MVLDKHSHRVTPNQRAVSHPLQRPSNPTRRVAATLAAHGTQAEVEHHHPPPATTKPSPCFVHVTAE